MLNKEKLIQKLNDTSYIFNEIEDELKKLSKFFFWLEENPLKYDFQDNCNLSYISWQDSLDTIFYVEKFTNPYQILGVDGSQIYIDPHYRVGCYLINIGLSYFQYDQKNSYVEFESIPYIFKADYSQYITNDLIDIQRTSLELEKGLEESLKKINLDLPYIFFYDGPLIFWYLQNKEQEYKNFYLKKYLQILQDCYENKIPIIGFISSPQSREFIQILKTLNGERIVPKELINNVNFDYLTDAEVCTLFLKPYSRSTVFFSNLPVVKYYKSEIKPCFVYLNVGSEIVRIDLPFWIIDDQFLFNTILQIILDQCIKGQGYPIVLSEAHEQAVIKNQDKEFFYELLLRMNREKTMTLKQSFKSLKKKCVAI